MANLWPKLIIISYRFVVDKLRACSPHYIIVELTVSIIELVLRGEVNDVSFKNDLILYTKQNKYDLVLNMQVEK